MNWWRNVLLAGSLLFIGIATLTPGAPIEASTLRPDFWCLACGSEAGADVSLNLALFLPLGIALALLRVSPMRAFAIGALLSITVESAQRLGIPPGRVASVTDILTNSAGTLIGAGIAWNHRHWLRPSPNSAKLFAIAGLIVVATFLGFTGWALGRDPQPPVSVSQHCLMQREGAFAVGFGWYQGSVSRGMVGDQQFTHTSGGPLILFGAIGADFLGTVDIDGRDARREFLPFLSIEGSRARVPHMMVGQHGDGAQLHVQLRGSQLRLPGPSLVLLNAFVAPGAVHRQVAFAVSSGVWTLSSTTGNETLSAKLAVTLSLGWTLFQTVVHVGDRLALVVTLLWLFMLWMPVGYWCALAGASSGTTGGGFGNLRRWAFVTTGVCVMVFTLWWVPRTMEIAATLPHEWLLSAAGLAAGVFLAALFTTTFPRNERPRARHPDTY